MSPSDVPTAQRRGFRLIFIAPVLALVTLLAWSFASPLGASPDDNFHLASIWCAAGDRPGVCEAASNPAKRLVPKVLVDAAECYKGRPLVTAACQDDLVAAGATRMVATAHANFNGGYPPLYYLAMSAFVGPNIVGSVLVMRIVNSILFVGVTTLLYLFLPRRRRSTLVWAWLITMIPLGVFLIASNNPSSWAITGVGSAWIALLGFFESVGRRKIALGVLFGVAALMAAGSRGDAAIYIILSILAVLAFTFTRTRSYVLGAILPAAAVVVALVFYFSSAQSAIVSTGLSGGGGPPSSQSGAGLFLSNLIQVPSLWAGVFGSWGLGWLDTTMPAIVSIGCLGIFAAIAFWGLRDHSRMKSILVIALAVVLWVLPAYILVRSNSVVGQEVQPRYLLPLMVVLAGFALLRVGRYSLSLSRIQLSVVVATLAVAQGLALEANLRRYISGSGVGGWNLDHNQDWWWSTPISPMVVWLGGGLAFAVLAVVLVRELALHRDLEQEFELRQTNRVGGPHAAQ